MLLVCCFVLFCVVLPSTIWNVGALGPPRNSTVLLGSLILIHLRLYRSFLITIERGVALPFLFHIALSEGTFASLELGYAVRSLRYLYPNCSCSCGRCYREVRFNGIVVLLRIESGLFEAQMGLPSLVSQLPMITATLHRIQSAPVRTQLHAARAGVRNDGKTLIRRASEENEHELYNRFQRIWYEELAKLDPVLAAHEHYTHTRALLHGVEEGTALENMKKQVEMLRQEQNKAKRQHWIQRPPSLFQGEMNSEKAAKLGEWEWRASPYQKACSETFRLSKTRSQMRNSKIAGPPGLQQQLEAAQTHLNTLTREMRQEAAQKAWARLGFLGRTKPMRRPNHYREEIVCHETGLPNSEQGYESLEHGQSTAQGSQRSQTAHQRSPSAQCLGKDASSKTTVLNEQDQSSSLNRMATEVSIESRRRKRKGKIPEKFVISGVPNFATGPMMEQHNE